MASAATEGEWSNWTILLPPSQRQFLWTMADKAEEQMRPDIPELEFHTAANQLPLRGDTDLEPLICSMPRHGYDPTLFPVSTSWTVSSD